MIIRPMKEADIETIYQIECDCFSMPWSIDSLKEEVNSLFAFYNVAAIDDEVVAYAGMRTVLDEGEITNIAVDPNSRGRGIGRELLESIVEQAKKRHISKITLEVRSSNEAAKTLYLSVGFKQIAIRKEYYQKPTEDAIIMQLQFND